MKPSALKISLGSFLATAIASNNISSNTIVSIPNEYTYLLPTPFTGKVQKSFATGTHTSNQTLNALFRSASEAPYISYSQEFLNLLGPHPPAPKLIQQRNARDNFAHEAGVWVPERNEIWFTSDVSSVGKGFPGTVYSFNLETEIIAPLDTHPRVQNPNGGYYFQGKVYFASYPGPRTSDYHGGIFSIDVRTLETEMVLNSYFGLPFVGLDDLVWCSNPANQSEKYLFFSDFIPYEGLAYGPLQIPQGQTPSSVYRWDPQEKILLPVISRNELIPNGVRVSPDMKKLYVTDSGELYGMMGQGAAAKSWFGPYIYSYDLDEDMFPVNRKLFAQVRQNVADGMHVDDQGRVWTGEGEGVVVRNAKGRVLGIFNSQFFQEDKSADAEPIANFALAGDVLVVLSGNRLWTVKLGEVVVGRDSSVVN